MYLNTILKGVSGTGKTYSTILYSVAIIENKSIVDVQSENYEEVFKRFNQYKNENLIENVTFHQSYSYEEFIEGIKPVLNNNDNVSYVLQDGIFKKFCIDNSFFDWSFLLNKDVSSKNARKNNFIIDSISNGNINLKKTKLGNNEPSKIVTIPINLIENLVCAINDNSITIQDVKNLNCDNLNINVIQYDTFFIKLYKDIIYQIVEEVTIKSRNISIKNKVFIIDEINRGNISKIFGELITLIEPTKRLGNLEELKIKLPYSQQLFGVPNNVYIIGTMNSNDHSTITLDIALRRRFHFIEILPNYNLFENVNINGLNILKMFKNINLRIEYILGKDFLIGHTYFLNLIKSPNIETLSDIFKYTIIPLLTEFFYNDFEKIRLILADNQTDCEKYQFIVKKSIPKDLFKNADLYLNPTYEINQEAFKHIESYKKI